MTLRQTALSRQWRRIVRRTVSLPDLRQDIASPVTACAAFLCGAFSFTCGNPLELRSLEHIVERSAAKAHLLARRSDGNRYHVLRPRPTRA